GQRPVLCVLSGSSASRSARARREGVLLTRNPKELQGKGSSTPTSCEMAPQKVRNCGEGFAAASGGKAERPPVLRRRSPCATWSRQCSSLPSPRKLSAHFQTPIRSTVLQKRCHSRLLG